MPHADHLDIMSQRRAHHGPDGGIHARGVAAAGEQGDAPGGDDLELGGQHLGNRLTDGLAVLLCAPPRVDDAIDQAVALRGCRDGIG